MPHKTPLKRSLSLFLVTFYGLGTVLGAGIYSLIGKIAHHSGMQTPFTFIFAAFIAFFTAISYAELGARYPFSAGAAYYVKEGFKQKWLAGITGWLMIFTGTVSAAAIANGFAGYLQVFVPIPNWLSIPTMILFLGAISIWGITESAIVASIVTFIEMAGLVLIIVLCRDSFQELPSRWHELIPTFEIKQWTGILSGSFIAFYMYIGFEDIGNIAEEIKNPKRILPLAIFLMFSIATFLYILVAIAVIFAVPIADLAQSNAPLAKVVQYKGYSPLLITGISLFALTNGILIQIIISSRILYGMANQKTAPKILAQVHKKTQTPVISTILIMMTVTVLALGFPIETLAQATSTVLLCIFVLVNLSLVILKLKKLEDKKAVSYSIFFPIIGAVLSFLFLVSEFII